MSGYPGHDRQCVQIFSFFFICSLQRYSENALKSVEVHALNMTCRLMLNYRHESKSIKTISSGTSSAFIGTLCNAVDESCKVSALLRCLVLWFLPRKRDPTVHRLGNLASMETIPRCSDTPHSNGDKSAFPKEKLEEQCSPYQGNQNKAWLVSFFIGSTLVA